MRSANAALVLTRPCAIPSKMFSMLWQRSPMGAILAMRAPPLMVCSARCSSPTTSVLLVSVTQRLIKLSMIATISLASSRNTSSKSLSLSAASADTGTAARGNGITCPSSVRGAGAASLLDTSIGLGSAITAGAGAFIKTSICCVNSSAGSTFTPCRSWSMLRDIQSCAACTRSKAALLAGSLPSPMRCNNVSTW